MLKAWLHHKLGRLDDAGQEDGDEPPAPRRDFAREDGLTSCVFERLAYLEPAQAWRLLRASCQESFGPELPADAPPGAPTWSFWPSLASGVDGWQVRSVQPDVVVTWGELVLLVEAKHRGGHWSDQWVEQIRAVRADPRFAGKRKVLVAAGGAELAAFARRVAEAEHELRDADTTFLLLRWGALRHAAEERRRVETAPGARAILGDLIAALETFGYARRFDFDSLPSAAAPFHLATPPRALARWSVQ